MPTYDLAGQVAIITGGNQGIGRGIALDMAQAGADIVIAARTVSSIEEVCGEVRALGRRTLGIPTDVTSAASIANLVQRTMDEFGRVDILVNNAGGSSGSTFRRGPLADLAEEDFDGAFAANTKSTWLCAKTVYPIMMRQQKGCILNISSVSAIPAHGTRVGFGAYSASKVAVNNLTFSMAAEWGPYIRVNAIMPGFIDTPRTAATRSPEGNAKRVASVAMGRFGSPEELAPLATFLASDAASYISGTLIEVHGGQKSSLPPLEVKKD